jgi:hypothetical protein
VPCLIEKINIANTNGEANTITLEAGTYLLTAPVPSNMDMADGPNGLPLVTSTLTIRGRGANATTIERSQAAPAFRLVRVTQTGALTLEGLTLQGGLLDPPLDPPPLKGFFGAGLFNRGTAVLINTVVANNRADRPTGGGGGGIWNEGLLIATDTSISRNRLVSGSGTFGGGIANSGGLLLLTNTTIDANINGEGSGGGIGNVNDGTVLLTNSTISRNMSLLDFSVGGGLFNGAGSTMILTNVTVADNHCEGGVRDIGGLANNGTAVLTNTIIARNTAVPLSPTVPGIPDCGGTGVITSLGHNLIGDPTGCPPFTLPLTRHPSDLTCDSKDPMTCPGLGPFTDNDTPGTGHFPLLPTSQAINAGNNTACLLTDQLEQPRVGVCDIGAIEFQGGVEEVLVHVGYLDNEHGTRNPADTPTPFDPDATTILISSGGVDTPHDTGVLRFENRTSAPVTIDRGLQVTTEGGVFQLWDDSLPITLAPGQNLVLAETANFNFDTSDFGLGSDPVVRGSVNGRAFEFTDTARVLLGIEDAGASGGNETTPHQVLGRIEGQAQSTVSLFR